MHSQILRGGSAAAVAYRRMRHIVGAVLGRDSWMWRTHEVKLINTASGDTVKIGEISYKLKTPQNPELVPVKHSMSFSLSVRKTFRDVSICLREMREIKQHFLWLVSDYLPHIVAQHLRWIMQKDLLGQDVFLIGPPGPLRRSIAMQYLELTKREVEYVALSRDTTETDLKQRREIRSGTAFYIDQCAVRAATQGRVLVLEGLEKVERNVLPVLNNLLENREMQLEDGRFLMSAERYDKLLQDHTKEELDSWKIVRVSEDFRVIALGLPVPKYKGNPLDPPLRSRFQARDIYYLPFKNTFPMLSSQQLIYRLYPYNSFLGMEGRTAVEGVLSRFELLDGRRQPAPSAILNVSTTRDLEGYADITLRCGVVDKNVTFQVPAGTEGLRPPNSSPTFISTPSHSQLMAEMMQSHMAKDICLIGAKGCGKSAIAREFAEMLGYSVEPVMLYQDMTARDLLQQRYTLPNGDTAWRPSPLVTAAIEGKLLLLDGIHRVNLGTLAVLSRLLHDRELDLYDGTRLLRSILPIHPSFRVLALAEPPVVGASASSSNSRGQHWLSPELLTMFLYHTVTPLAKAEEMRLIQGLTLNVPKEAAEQLLHLAHSLRETNDPTHMMVMEDMLKDFLLGEHLLLVGNQGVGKNKIVDRFLHLLNRPREYLQLHRDTTVQTLTLQPSVRDGIITYEDSPLVKAVKLGHILVIDEADKAPTNVTCILKTLVESGEMILADGRRIISSDIFSCHAVDNPKPQAELAMLKEYGPDVPDATLQKLVAAFGELRSMADHGTITYPYSTREVVNIVRHLQKFPDEGLANVVRNVFDFDSYNKDMREVLIEALHKHGIPIGAKPSSVKLAKELPLPEVKMTGYWTTNQGGNARRKLLCPTETHPIDIKGPVFLRVQGYPCNRQESRALSFSEEKAHWQIPMNEVNIICDVTTNDGIHSNRNIIRTVTGYILRSQLLWSFTDILYVATCNPVSLYSMKERGEIIHCMELYDVFPRTISGVWQPFVTVAPLGSPLDGQLVLHEEQSNTVLHLDMVTGAVRRLMLSPESKQPTTRASNWWSSKEQQGGHKMCHDFAYKNWLLFYKEDSNQLEVLDVLEGQVHSISLPINLKSVFLVAEDRWLLLESKTNRKFLLTKPMHMTAEDSGVCQLHSISEDTVSSGHRASTAEMSVPEMVSCDQLPNENLSAALDQKIVSPNRILADSGSFAQLIVGFPDLVSHNEVYSFKRPVDLSLMTTESGAHTFLRGGLRSSTPKQNNCVSLLSANQMVRALPPNKVPLKEVYPKDVTPPMTAAYLEVTDLNSKKVKYIPVPRSMTVSPYTNWLSKVSESDVLMAPLGSGGVVTVDMGGYVRLWETGLDTLQRSLMEWRNMIGTEDGRPVQRCVDVPHLHTSYLFAYGTCALLTFMTLFTSVTLIGWTKKDFQDFIMLPTGD
ncbi:von Willebrand factor A domain-containing protein 8 [Collichthys lucidus]|uniref:von Willebrand factor A domain-containing protein 8 n=1 Tax=Collichthys lucidus TaxID=240159 RepID=A0A4U5U2F9_COLLU|nr:von Willebrand factor A domain-containing protein 8 [Collichthys lucidus]